MLRSLAKEVDTEFLLTKDAEHIQNVWTEIEATLPIYWQKFIDAERDEKEEVKILGSKVETGKTEESDGAILTRAFDKAIADFESEAEKYREFFNEEAVEEYEEDPNAFKHAMTRDLPVIARTLRQPNKELKEWQKKFRMARPNDLLSVFTNVLDFYEEWNEGHPVSKYVKFDSPDEFDLAPVNNDDELNIPGVIGMGIKTIVLFHTDPERMPPLGRYALFGLYFLSGKKSFDMASDSSEFLMVNDESKAANGSYVMDQNYWYPYDVFSMYLLRIFRWIDERSAIDHFTVDKKLRYVYVEKLLEAVCAEHTDDMKTMRAHDSFGIPA